MPDPAPPGLWATLAPFVSPVVSVVGSFLISRFTAKAISKKAAAKQAFGELLKTLDTLEENIADLLLIPGADPKAHNIFQRACMIDARLGRRITELFTAHRSKSRLAGTDPVPPRVSKALNLLRTVAIADELVSALRPAYLANDPRFRAISDRVSDLRSELREEAEDMKCSDLA